MINHRGPEYAAMLDRMTRNLQTVFATAGDVYFITSSGTGSMETAVVNTLSPGDKVLSLVIGVFGKRFAEIAEAYGADVTRLEFPLGKAADPDEVAQALAEMAGLQGGPVYSQRKFHRNHESAAGNRLGRPSELRCARIGRRRQQRRRRAHIGRRLGHRRGGYGIPEVLGIASGHQHGVVQRKGVAGARDGDDAAVLLRRRSVSRLPGYRPAAVHTLPACHVHAGTDASNG